MTNGTTPKPMTLFICGKPLKSKSKIWCSTAGCEQLLGASPTLCTFKLGGRLEGTTCDRALCAGCALSSNTCPPHQRLLEKRQQR